jgi:hypothetical protein
MVRHSSPRAKQAGTRKPSGKKVPKKALPVKQAKEGEIRLAGPAFAFKS